VFNFKPAYQQTKACSSNMCSIRCKFTLHQALPKKKNMWRLFLRTGFWLQGSSVVLSVPHGSLYIFNGKAVTHGTTRIVRPNRLQPSRISLVLFRHQSTLLRNHGKEHMPVFNDQTVEVLEKAQLSMSWIECRCIRGDFRKQTGQIFLSEELLGLIKKVRKKYENFNEKPTDSD